MALVTVRMTQAEVAQMLEYLWERDREGWYMGNREQFERRHKSIRECLDKALRKSMNADSGGSANG